MNLFKSKLFYIITIIIALIVIFLVLFNTIFYNYKTKLNTYLDDYYVNQSDEDIDKINELIDRYKNNKIRTQNINSLISAKVDKWINKYNDAYDNIDDLNNSELDLSNKVNYLFNNIHNLDVIKELDDFNIYIKSLEDSKEAYLNGMSSYENEDFNGAYNKFINVIEDDSYYEETQNLIDNCISSTLDQITSDVDKLSTVGDDGTDEDKISCYTSIYNYLINELATSSYELDKSKKFSDMLNSVETNLTNTYVSYAKGLASDNKYVEASDALNEGIKLLLKGDVNVAALTDLKYAYDSMKPVSLISLTATSKKGEWIKNETAITNYNNNTYAQALVFYKGLRKSYSENVIVYNLNKEYASLDFTVSLGKDNIIKSKDTGTIKIKGDNKTIKNISFNKDLTEEELNIDIKNVNNLTFEYIIKYNEDNEYENPIINVILGNPILNKY